MRMRIIPAAVVLGLGLVGITLAQQGGQKPKDRAGEKAKLRVQVARLRADAELLQLEHDVVADMLRENMKAVKNAELTASMKGPMTQYAKTLIEAKTEASKKEALKAAGEGEVAKESVHVPVPDEMYDMAFGGSDSVARLGPLAVERLKKEFVQKAAELAEKRLELAEVEKQYNEAR
jgi:hypothetical protein